MGFTKKNTKKTKGCGGIIGTEGKGRFEWTEPIAKVRRSETVEGSAL
jgi:hypothetical protein